jgi:hypothetical protein
MKHFYRRMKIIFSIALAISEIESGAQEMQFEWAGSFGGAMDETANGIAVDEAGNLYCAGNFSGTADFDLGPGTFPMTSQGGSSQMYVCKYAADQSLLWARQISGSGSGGYLNTLEIDGEGSLFISGSFGGNVDFDPGTDTLFKSAPGSPDAFLLKLDSDGNFIWVRAMGGDDWDDIRSLTIDNNGDIIVFVEMSGDNYIDGAPENYILTTEWEADVAVIKFKSTGELVWAKTIGGPGYEVTIDATVDDDNNIYSIGWYNVGTPDLDPGVGEFLLSMGQFIR